MKRSLHLPPSIAPGAFTLPELVVVLAIAAILAVYAAPLWQTQIARTHRVDAAAAVYRAAQFVANLATAGAGNEVTTLPSGLDQAPQSGTAIYRLRVLPANDSNGGYAIEAEPVEAGPMNADSCGTFVLDATGLRSNRGHDGNEAPAVKDCWNTR
jgi:type IV pilus assembly protein PilE